MNTLLKKFVVSVVSVLSDSLVVTTRKVIRYISSYKYRKLSSKMLNLSSTKDRFTEIYNSNLWRGEESKSGPGSTLEFTHNLRNNLPIIFLKYKISTIFDAPCGDLNWMINVLDDNKKIDYLGGDVVDKIIQMNIEKYSSQRIKFINIDITKDSLPNVDLMIVRDCLFHLSFKDIHNFLVEFSRSEIKYLLTTTHILEDDYVNTDIISGDSRPINIFSSPFNFPSTPLDRIRDYVEPAAPQEMCLFDRSHIRTCLEHFEKTSFS